MNRNFLSVFPLLNVLGGLIFFNRKGRKVRRENAKGCITKQVVLFENQHRSLTAFAAGYREFIV
jgi:hypothetical protein